MMFAVLDENRINVAEKRNGEWSFTVKELQQLYDEARSEGLVTLYASEELEEDDGSTTILDLAKRVTPEDDEELFEQLLAEEIQFLGYEVM